MKLIRCGLKEFCTFVKKTGWIFQMENLKTERRIAVNTIVLVTEMLEFIEESRCGHISSWAIRGQ